MTQRIDNSALTRRLEASEIAAWRTIFAGPTPELRAQLGIGYEETRGVLLAWNRSSRSVLFNRVIGLGVFEPADDLAIDAILARATAERSRTTIHVAPTAEPPDLGERLAKRGLTRVPSWLIHYRTLGEQLPDAVPPRGYRIDRVTPATAANWGDALFAAWSMSSASAAGELALMLAIQNSPEYSCFAVVHEASDEIVGGAMLHAANGVAGLYADGVRAEHREHDLQDALIAVRLAEAQRLGCEIATAQTLANHPAAHNMENAGFEVAYERQNYIVPK